MFENIGVECKFGADGTVRIYRILLDQSWISVEQGRQWVDQIGRHGLILLPDGNVHEICLCSDTMTWQFIPSKDRQTHLA
jgi:hypothetical protein